MRLLAAALLIPSAVFAAALSGVVNDPSGAAVADAAIELTHEASGRKAAARTDPAGRFQFDDIETGAYRITVTAKGFESYTQSFTVPAAVLEIRLAVQAMKEQVEVPAHSGLANSDPNYRKLRDGDIAESYAVENLVLARDTAAIKLVRESSASPARCWGGPPLRCLRARASSR